jgi:hypothetical protein
MSPPAPENPQLPFVSSTVFVPRASFVSWPAFVSWLMAVWIGAHRFGAEGSLSYLDSPPLPSLTVTARLYGQTIMPRLWPSTASITGA